MPSGMNCMKEKIIQLFHSMKSAACKTRLTLCITLHLVFRLWEPDKTSLTARIS